VSAVAAGQAVEAPAPFGGRPHLAAVDVVRVAMIAGVIAVHTIAYTTNPTNATAGAVASLLHVNREVFFFLTPFVLTYSYGMRHGWSLAKFWKKRYILVGVPYLVWTAVYFVADGGGYHPWTAPVRRLAGNLLAGTARYHLYFLLVTMEIYAVFPLLLWLLRATRRHHGALLAASFVAQVAFTATLHYARGWSQSLPVLGFWARHPDQLLPSYQLYLIAGGVAAMHLDDVATWVRAHRRAIGIAAVVGLAASLGSYVLDHLVAGMDAAASGEVFQPMMVVTSAATIAGLFALGQRWAERGPDRRFAAASRTASDVSFGVYLAHPLALQAFLGLAGPLVARTAAGEVPSGIVLIVDLAVVVPLLYAVSAVAVRWARRTPLSLAVAGRPQLHPQPVPQGGSV